MASKASATPIQTVADELEGIAGRLAGIHEGLDILSAPVLTALRCRGPRELYVLLLDALRREREALDTIRGALRTADEKGGV